MRSTADFGDVPSWLTLLAALVAAGYARRAHRLNRELAEARVEELVAADIERRDAALRAQAERVALWLAETDVQGRARLGVVVRNDSELPITHLKVFLGRRSEDSLNTDVGGPVTVPPREDVVFTLPQLGVDDLELYQADALYTDAAGNPWRRNTSGALRRAPG
ncbi:hypothetical protein ACIB24_16425 [Spongisporangium articulatum]|uniref:Uncharacterized protein n=1 Tax=Spongisporangium articulatum TaxID=3362603 RepID=A0ABW8AQL1_9ACTN